MSEWTLIPRVDPGSLTAARLQAHYAVQIVAAAGNTLISKRPDDSQQAVEFDRATNSIVSPVVSAEGHRLSLRVESLQLRVIDGNSVSIDTFDLIGQTLDAGTVWAGAALARICGTQSTLQRPVHHDFPGHPIASGALFERVPGLTVIANGFANADTILRSRAKERSLKIWPHHFDIAFLIPGARAETSIGVGWSPGDGGIDEPYFYVTPWPYPSHDVALDALPTGGRWHTQGWTGAVLTFGSLVNESASAQASQTEAVVDAAIEICEHWVNRA